MFHTWFPFFTWVAACKPEIRSMYLTFLRNLRYTWNTKSKPANWMSTHEETQRHHPLHHDQLNISKEHTKQKIHIKTLGFSEFFLGAGEYPPEKWCLSNEMEIQVCFLFRCNIKYCFWVAFRVHFLSITKFKGKKTNRIVPLQMI